MNDLNMLLSRFREKMPPMRLLRTSSVCTPALCCHSLELISRDEKVLSDLMKALLTKGLRSPANVLVSECDQAKISH